MSNERIEELQQRLNKNMDKAVKLAEKNCVRNEDGCVVWTKEERMQSKRDLIYDDDSYISDMYEDSFEEMMEVGQEFSITLKLSLTNRLKTALVEFSYGQLDETKAEKIAIKVIDKIDLTNSALNHKGMNWLAREILKYMGINTYKVVNKDKAHKAMLDCSEKYNKALKNLADE